MESVILSICIPTYKRLRILETNLINVANCCEGFYEYVEVIVSDNDNLRSSNEVVKRINSTYPDFQIRYFSNSENFGHAFNYYEAVRNSSGVFTWLLGDDDFINLESVAEILNTIHLHKDVDFIFFKNKEMNYEDYISRKDSQLQLSNLNTLSEYNKIGFLKDLILPKYDNEFIGKMMISVFRTEVWKKTLLTSSELFGFNSLTSTYPHSYIYSKQFLNKETLYLESI